MSTRAQAVIIMSTVSKDTTSINNSKTPLFCLNLELSSWQVRIKFVNSMQNLVEDILVT